MENFIPRPKNDRDWPAKIVAVGWDRGMADVSARSLRRSDKFANLNAAMIWPMRDWLVREICNVYDDSVLVIIPDCYEFLCDAGAWDFVDRGELRLTGHDERTGRGPRCIVESPPTIVQFADSKGKPRCTFADPANWGATIGGNLNHVAKCKDVAEWVANYDEFRREMDLGSEWRLTAASQAWHGWRLNWMVGEIERMDGSPDERLIELANYGGRCECFHLGDIDASKGIWHYDANQLYSSAASMCPMPYQLIGPCSEDATRSEPMNCVAEVTIEAPVPIVPYRANSDSGPDAIERTIWPTGEFRTWLCGPELMLAETCNMLKKVHVAYKYNCAVMLREWAEKMYAYRLRAGNALLGSAKSVALSLYGKFGQRKREWLLCDNDTVPPTGMLVGEWYELGLNGMIRFRTLGGITCRESEDGWQDNSNPAVSAWIASMARVQLQMWLSATHGHVYYCDTDSLIVDDVGKCELVKLKAIGSGLGQLKLVGNHKSLTINGIKQYVADGKLVASGIPESARPKCSAMEWSATETFTESMQQRQLPRAGKVSKKRRLTNKWLYKHGVPSEGGKVTPFHLGIDK